MDSEQNKNSVTVLVSAQLACFMQTADIFAHVVQFLVPRHAAPLSLVCKTWHEVLSPTGFYWSSWMNRILERERSALLLPLFKQKLALHQPRDFCKSAMSHQFIQDRLTELLRTAVHCMSNSGYFTRNSANGAVVRVSSKSTCRASLLDTLRKKYIFNDNNCTSDNNKHHVQVWEYESSKEIFAFVRSHFKQPPVWLCSYERPRMMRIVAGCLKQIVQLLNHKHRLHSDFLLLSAYRKDNTFHLVFQNEIFVVWVVGNIC